MSTIGFLQGAVIRGPMQSIITTPLSDQDTVWSLKVQAKGLG